MPDITPKYKHLGRQRRKKYKEETVIMSLRLPVSLAAKLRRIAADREITVNELLNSLIITIK